MKITVEFIDVYNGVEHKRTEEIPVVPPGQDIEGWADDFIFPHTGDSNALGKDAGYFAEIVACDDIPSLVGREFEWGV